jgi:hypothetical protein
MAEVFAGVGLILAAGISAIASILVARLRVENTSQHDTNIGQLERNFERMGALAEDISEIKTDVRETKADHDRHIEWHIANTRSVRRE